MGSKEGASFVWKNSGMGINSGVLGSKFPEFSKIPSMRHEASLGGRNPSQGGFAKRVASAWKPKNTKRRMVMGMDMGL